MSNQSKSKNQGQTVIKLQNELPKDAFKQPFTRAFYGIMLKLEEKFAKKIVTLEEIGNLTEMYGQIVSYYDSVGDPIKFYFLEKIQVALTETRTFDMITKVETKTDDKRGSVLSQVSSQLNPRTPINGKVKKVHDQKKARSLSQSSNTSSGTSSEEEEKDTVQELPDNVKHGLISVAKQEEEIAKVEEPTERPRNVSITTMKKTRQKKMSLMLQLNKAQQEEQPNQYNQLLGSYESNVSKNDENVKQQLRDQSDALQQRLERRKNKNPSLKILQNTSLGQLAQVDQLGEQSPNPETGSISNLPDDQQEEGTKQAQ